MSFDKLAREVVTIYRGHVDPHTRHTVESALAHFGPSPIANWEFGTGDDHRAVVVERTTEPVHTSVLDDLNTLDGVSLQRNMALTPSAIPRDTLYGDQWALTQMSAEAAWDCIKAQHLNPQIRVAIIDSGVAQGHPDLQGQIHNKSKRFTVNPPDNAIEDEDGHGTYLAGTIAAVTDNRRGVASATWPLNIKILAHKFYDPWNVLTSAAAARAIVDAVDEGARVINASWHVGLQSDVLFDAIRYAELRDVLFVAAAGNEGTNNDELPIWPASYSDSATYGLTNVVSVMATNRHDDKPGYSNYGKQTVDLAAPGQGVLSTHYYLEVPQYREYSGTSVAAAHVTAAAALVRAIQTGMTAPQVKQHLRGAVVANNFLDCVAKGRLDLAAAVCPIV